MYPSRFKSEPRRPSELASVSVSEFLFRYGEACPLGDMIRQSKAGVSNNFRADIVAYDENPSQGVEPFADIRSSYDQREAWIAKYNAEQIAAHEPTTTLSPTTGASVGDVGAASAPAAPAASAPAAAAAAPAAVAPAAAAPAAGSGK